MALGAVQGQAVWAIRGAISAGRRPGIARVCRDRRLTGQRRKWACLSKGFLGALTQGLELPVTQFRRTRRALQEQESMEAIRHGCQTRLGRAEPPEQRVTHQELTRPPHRRFPALTVVGWEERELLLEIVNALLANNQTPEHLDDHGSRIPSPRTNPGRQDADRAVAGSAQVPPRPEKQEQATAEPQHLTIVGAVPLDDHTLELVTSQMPAIRIRA